MKSAVLVLAAGRSRRFGPENKLIAPLRGIPLIAHAASAARSVAVDLRLAVVSDEEVAACLEGYDLLRQVNPQAGQADNLRLGVATAREADVERLIVCLADMPNVTPHVLETVLGRCTDDTASVSSDGTHRMPPACFPAARFDALLSIEGDRGAGRLLRNVPLANVCVWPPHILADVDTPEKLAQMSDGAPGPEGS